MLEFGRQHFLSGVTKCVQCLPVCPNRIQSHLWTFLEFCVKIRIWFFFFTQISFTPTCVTDMEQAHKSNICRENSSNSLYNAVNATADWIEIPKLGDRRNQKWSRMICVQIELGDGCCWSGCVRMVACVAAAVPSFPWLLLFQSSIPRWSFTLIQGFPRELMTSLQYLDQWSINI